MQSSLLKQNKTKKQKTKKSLASHYKLILPCHLSPKAQNVIMLDSSLKAHTAKLVLQIVKLHLTNTSTENSIFCDYIGHRFWPRSILIFQLVPGALQNT